MFAKKKNISVDASTLGKWDDYADQAVEKALPRLYGRAHAHSEHVRQWYWVSIARKRVGSMVNRALSFALLVVGAVLPLIAAILPDNLKLMGTQMAVASLGLAGLLQAMDKIFGWSSGWLRYISTVTAMESATRQFELAWGSYIIERGNALAAADRKPLFDLAKSFETEITRLQEDETSKWVVEFNNSSAVLGDLIKSQRESADKVLQAAQATVDKQRIDQAEQAKASALGALEVAIKHKAAAIPVIIAVDDQGEKEPYVGSSWVKMNLQPGYHKVSVSFNDGANKIERVASVPAGAVVKLEVDLS